MVGTAVAGGVSRSWVMAAGIDLLVSVEIISAVASGSFLGAIIASICISSALFIIGVQRLVGMPLSRAGGSVGGLLTVRRTVSFMTVAVEFAVLVAISTKGAEVFLATEVTVDTGPSVEALTDPRYVLVIVEDPVSLIISVRTTVAAGIFLIVRVGTISYDEMRDAKQTRAMMM